MRRLAPFVAAAFLAAAPPASRAEEAKAEPAKPTFTPYGFLLLNAFWDSGPLATRDYPGQAQVAGDQGGAFLMSARQSRLGLRVSIPEEGWSGAKIDGVAELDFKAGQMPTCTAAACTAPASTSWYNGVVRLRLANAVASWKTSYGTWSVLAGQDYGLVAPLFATSLAWVADPIFWQAGNLWRRSPQIRLTYGNTFDAVGLSLALAMLSPADNTGAASPTAGASPGAGVDFGAGNRSRVPDLEGRLGLSYRMDGKKVVELGGSFHFNKRRYLNTAVGGTEFDATATTAALDLEVNVPYLTLKGEAFTAKGTDDTYAGISTAVVPGATTADVTLIPTRGVWAQLVLKPVSALDITAGYGVEVVTEASDLAVLTAAQQQGARTRNSQFAAGVIVNANKWWRFGLEYCQTRTTFFAATPAPALGNYSKVNQIALSNMVSF